LRTSRYFCDSLVLVDKRLTRCFSSRIHDIENNDTTNKVANFARVAKVENASHSHHRNAIHSRKAPEKRVLAIERKYLHKDLKLEKDARRTNDPELSAIPHAEIARPRRPLSAFLLFNQFAQKELGEAHKNMGGANITYVADKWKKLDKEEKKVYEDWAARDRQRFVEEMDSWAYRNYAGQPPTPFSLYLQSRLKSLMAEWSALPASERAKYKAAALEKKRSTSTADQNTLLPPEPTMHDHPHPMDQSPNPSLPESINTSTSSERPIHL